MNTKLILVEGIPGSGKTTIAGRIARWCEARGARVNLYIEGEAHPADLGWIAAVPIGLYDGLLDKYRDLSDAIRRSTTLEGEHALIAYTRVNTEDQGFYRELEAYEVYDGRVPDEVFFRLHYDRWQSFGRQAAGRDEVNIFECAFLQNHVNELLFWRDVGDDEAIAHLGRLLKAVKDLSPMLIYLSQPDVRETIARVAAERVSPQGERWMDRVIEYCETSPFGQRSGIRGLKGAYRFFEIRKALELKAIEQLAIPHIIVENPDYDWEAVWARIEAYLAGTAAC